MSNMLCEKDFGGLTS